MKRDTRRLRLVAGIAGLLGVAWWLFGFTTHRQGPFTTRLHRHWGRVTRIDLSVTDGRRTTRERVLFPWSEPYEPGDPVSSCAAILPEVWQDWDGDGNWDTWLYRVGPDRQGECSVEYRVDLSGDGRPDWRFIRRYGEYEQARSKIVTRRGF